MKKKWKRKILVVLFTLLALISLSLYTLSRVTPIINSQAGECSRTFVTEVINVSVGDVMKRSGITYRDLISVERGEDGSVLSVSANTVEINKLKADVSLKLVEELKTDMNSRLYIPIGNLSGVSVFSGRGMRLPIKLLIADSVMTFIESEFSSVGINQSWHRILLRVKVRVTVTVLTRATTVEVEDSVIIGETVIVGKIPDAYTALNKLDDGDIGDVIDFRAQ